MPRKDALKRRNRVVIGPDGKQRDHHGVLPPTTAERIDYCQYLMATGQWVRGVTDREVAEDWGMSARRIRDFSTEAGRRLEHWGDKEHALQLVRERCVRWIEESDPKDRVKAAELLLKSVGALTEKHEVSHVIQNMSDEEVARQAIRSMVLDDMTRDIVRAELAAWDERRALPAVDVKVLEISELPDATEAGESETCEK